MSWLTYKSRIFINSMQVLQPEIMEMNISRDTFTYHCHHKTTSWMRAWWLHQHQSHVADDSSSSSLSDTYLLAPALVGGDTHNDFFLNWTPKSCAAFKLCRAYVASYALGCITRGIFFQQCIVFLWFYHALYLWKQIGMFHFSEKNNYPHPAASDLRFEITIGSKNNIFNPFHFGV